MAGGCAVLKEDWERTWSEQREPSRTKGKTVVGGSESFCPPGSGVRGTVKIQCLKLLLLKLAQIHPVVFGVKIDAAFCLKIVALELPFTSSCLPSFLFVVVYSLKMNT